MIPPKSGGQKDPTGPAAGKNTRGQKRNDFGPGDCGKAELFKNFFL
jgi:hypothetical protein